MGYTSGEVERKETARQIRVSSADREILQGLGRELAAISEDKAQREKARLWTALNDRSSERPMVWINEIPWHEMDVSDELTTRCEDPWLRQHEGALRRTIYQWRHMRSDMVASPFIACPLAVHSTSFGITEDVDVVKTDEDNAVVSRHFNIQIKDPEDLEKIKMPVVTHDEEFSAHSFQVLSEIYKDIMPVKKTGIQHIWFTPWDNLIRWWGIAEAMMDLVLRPEMVHQAVERMVQAMMIELDQYIELNVLSDGDTNVRVGSGGYAYTDELPGDSYDPERVMPKNMWGCSNAQIFSDVSPEMHWEFAIEHDLKWLERWGMTYYGCCEPLGGKLDVLRRIPNLRKFSVSPWNDRAKLAGDVGTDYVLSVKPNPAIFLNENWSSAAAEDQIRTILREMDGCHLEIIMKDISTVNYHPERLWEWSEIADRIVAEG